MPAERSLFGPGLAGLGLRAGHYDVILERGLRADCAEAISENFMNRGGRPRAVIERVRREMPVILHGVGLSIGSVDPLDQDYLDQLARLAQETEPLFVSDHLCFGSVDGDRAFDLWPLPYSEEAIHHVTRRVLDVQERLKRRIVLENVSSYVTYRSSEMEEVEFLSSILERADCLCLLDINNVFVSASNLGYSAREFLQQIPPARVAYYHLAGHTDLGTHLLDDHGSAVPDSVWDLFEIALGIIGARPTIIEWDSKLPGLLTVEAEAAKAKLRLSRVVESRESIRESDRTARLGARSEIGRGFHATR
jgi:uncharacterized protein